MLHFLQGKILAEGQVYWGRDEFHLEHIMLNVPEKGSPNGDIW